MIPKAQHLVTLPFQKPTPLLIRRYVDRMLATVQLHY
jgi:hypothetical protein